MIRLYDSTVFNLENKFKSKANEILNQQLELIIKRYKKEVLDKKDDDYMEETEVEIEAERVTKKIFKTEEGVQTIMKELLPFYINVGELSGEFFKNVYFTDLDLDLYGIVREDYMLWLENYGAEQIKNINKTTKDITKRIIKNGMIEGLSNVEISKMLSDKIKDFNIARAEVIAETEIHNTFSFVNNLMATKNKFKYKKWLSSRDASVRPNHQTYDSMGYIPMEEEFANSLMYPGDSNAPPSETVRCRCVIRYSMEN